MNVKEIEKLLYSDEQFLVYLPILKKENWDKARPSKRFEFMKRIHEIIASIDECFAKNITLYNFNNIDLDVYQNFIFSDQEVFVDLNLVNNRDINPYLIIKSYFFEIFLHYYRQKALANDGNEELKKMIVNLTCSNFDSWSNLFARSSEEFLYQPITRESYKNANKLLYTLLKYMNSNYGMDDYIGESISLIMVEGFYDEKKDKRTENNYQIMEKRYNELLNDEEDKINQLYDFLDGVDKLEDLDDEQFYSLFNDKIIHLFGESYRLALYEQFAIRQLKRDDAFKLFGKIELVKDELGNDILLIDEVPYYVDVKDEFNLLISKLIGIKIKNKLLDEIKDDKLKKDICDTYEYLSILKDENSQVGCKYLAGANPYSECMNFYRKYYYEMIQNYINNAPIINVGNALVQNANVSKSEVFVMFAFDKNYDEIRQEEIKVLKEEYDKKVGGMR